MSESHSSPISFSILSPKVSIRTCKMYILFLRPSFPSLPEKTCSWRERNWWEKPSQCVLCSSTVVMKANPIAILIWILGGTHAVGHLRGSLGQWCPCHHPINSSSAQWAAIINRFETVPQPTVAFYSEQLLPIHILAMRLEGTGPVRAAKRSALLSRRLSVVYTVVSHYLLLTPLWRRLFSAGDFLPSPY